MGDKLIVTGFGIISGIGLDVKNTLQSLVSEQSGLRTIKFLQTTHSEFPVSEVQLSDSDLRKLVSLDENVVITRASLMGIVAAREAISMAALTFGKNSRIGFISGTTVGGMEKSENFYSDFLSNDLRNEYISAHDCGACTESIADHCGEFSYVTTISTACSSAANSIVFGANMIKQDLLDCVIVGGSECLTRFHLNGFKTLLILDNQPCKPFDASRAGLNLGEGAAYLVLESEKHALSRDAKALCYLAGYANSCDAYHQTASSPEGIGAQIAMEKALEKSTLAPSDIDYINAHGTGTINNDESEGIAITQVFKNKIPYVSSTKPFTGHTTSAAGAVEAVISILSMRNRFVPANLNFKNQMEQLPFTPVRKNITNVTVKHVLSNSFGFGGNNTSLIFSSIN